MRTFFRSALLCCFVFLAAQSLFSDDAVPAKKESFTFVQLCDPQLGMTDYFANRCALEQAVKQINLLSPDFVIICGDLVHRPMTSTFNDFKKVISELKMPCHIVPGNHDAGMKPSASTLKMYRELIGDDMHSFEHKGCSFIMVNTQLWKFHLKGETEKQDKWFKEELALASKRGGSIFVAGHYPPFLKKADEGEVYQNLPPDKRKWLLDLLVKHGVSVMLTGHAHRLILNDYQGVALVTGESTAKNTDGRPFGFRLWSVGEDAKPAHSFVELLPIEKPGKDQVSKPKAEK